MEATLKRHDVAAGASPAVEPMTAFARLGALVGDRWRERHFNEQAFPSIAADALREMNLPAVVTPTDVLRWVLAEGRGPLPSQVDLDGRFGQPPLTVYRGRGFYIDVLFWFDGTTNIHQHGFWGAFQVLAGSSVHCRFGFDLLEEVNHRLRIGSLALEDTELLTVGAIRKILGGDRFIHSLFHLDRPSVSIVVRTLDDMRSVPQYTYRRPALSFDPVKDPERTRCLQVVSALRMMRHADHERILAEFLRTTDLLTALQSILMLSLDEQRDPAELHRLIDLARGRHGSLMSLLAPVVDEQRRELAIVRRRQSITDASHRFFLALLLNLQTREPILDFVKLRTGTDDPAAQIVTWLRAMADLSPDRTVLGQRFDDVGLRLLQGALMGLSLEGTRLRFGDELARADLPESELHARLGALAASPIFQPCFRT